MTLKQLREALRDETARFDLVDSSGTNLGMDTYINQAVKYANMLKPLESTSDLQLVAAGTSLLEIPQCHIVSHVWASSTASNRWELKRLRPEQIRKYYYEVGSALTTGSPVVYSLANAKLSPSSDTPTAGPGGIYAVTDLDDLDFTPSSTHTYLVIRPVPDAAVTIRVEGYFMFPALSADDSTNQWLIQYPELIKLCTKRELEMSLRNSQGVKDFDLLIQEFLNRLNIVDTMQEIASFRYINEFDMGGY